MKTTVEVFGYFDKAAFESSYDELVEASEVIPKAVELRNTGWDVFREGFEEQGTRNLLDSVNMLRSAVNTPFPPSGVTRPEHLQAFLIREVYASATRLAQAFCAAGEFEHAINQAQLAQTYMPLSIVHTFPLTPGDPDDASWLNAQADPYETFTRTAHYIDQYEVMFSGRLALVLSAASSWGTTYRGRELAGRARELAPRSQDPSRVLFPDTEMSREERDDTARRFTGAARAATVASYMPVPVAGAIAKRVCSR